MSSSAILARSVARLSASARPQYGRGTGRICVPLHPYDHIGGKQHYCALGAAAQQMGSEQQQQPLKTVLVVAVALIDQQQRVLLAQRPQGKAMAGLWEFPGGKVTTFVCWQSTG